MKPLGRMLAKIMHAAPLPVAEQLIRQVRTSSACIGRQPPAACLPPALLAWTRCGPTLHPAPSPPCRSWACRAW